jgi:para-aminobenzoate synthetase component I
MNKEESINYLNELGENKTPCFFIIDYAMKETLIWKTKEIPNTVLISFPSFTNCKKISIKNSITIDKNPFDYNSYKTAFDNVQKHLLRGNSFLVNLTAESSITTNASINEMYHASKAPYTLAFKDDFIVFSPEPFIIIKKTKIQTFPMKGTINADLPKAKETILTNKKEMAEHATIVDLLRNDLSIVANNVQVSNYRYIDTIKSKTDNLLHVSSCIEGEIKPDLQNKLGTIIFSMLPAGSICGAPKHKTLSIIEEVESHIRGYYTGIMGYFDGENLESSVMIRFIQKKENNLYYKSGGGITIQSNIDDEYNELIQKIYVPTH